MPKSNCHEKKRQPKRILALPDLEQAKAAVLNSLMSAAGSGPTSTRFASSSPESNGAIAPTTSVPRRETQADMLTKQR